MQNDTTLFVIFHGSWAFLHTYLIDPDQIFARPPDMGDDHVYLSGSWLGEHNLLRGSLHRLVNVTGDPNHQPKFDPTVNYVTAHSFLGSVNTHGPLTSLILPAPLAIHSLGQLRIPAGNIVEDGKPTTSDVITSLIQVFEYSYDSTQPAQLEEFPWSPIPIPDAATGAKVATLHMFAEHDAEGSPDHMTAAFEYCYTLLGHNVTLDPTGIVPVDPSQQRPVPSLLAPRCFELEPIGSRTARMADVGRLKGTVDSAGKSADLRDAWPTQDSGCMGLTLKRFGQTRIIRGMPRSDNPTCLPGQGHCP